MSSDARAAPKAGSAPSTDDFDAFSARYDHLLDQAVAFSGGDSGYFSQYKVDCVVQREHGQPIRAMLDLGCGVGNATALFAQAWPDARFEGIDVSEQSIVVALHRSSTSEIPRANFQVYDGERLPFASDTLDLVFIAVVLHHVPVATRTRLLTEVRRVLRPGGRLYIFEHNPYNPITRKVVRECPFDENAILLRPGECRELVRSLHFEQVRVHFRLFIPPKPWLRALLPLERWLEWLPLGGQYYVRAVKPA